MGDDIQALLLAAGGFRSIPPSGADHTEAVFSALRRIGAHEDRLVEFGERISAAGANAGPLDVSKSMRVSAERIEGAMAAIERGLRDLNEGLSVIAFARSTATPGSATRQASLAEIHAELVTIIGRAVAGASGADGEFDRALEASIPSYSSAVNFSDTWQGAFWLAAERAKDLHKRFPRSKFRAQPKDHSAWLARLLPCLADVYFEVTGRPATVASRNPSKPSPFPRFVREIWPYFDGAAGEPPKDARIRALLPPTRKG